MSDDFNPATKFRPLTGGVRILEKIIVIALTLVSAAWAGELHVYLNLTFFKEQFLGFFFAFGMAGVFLRVKRRSENAATVFPGTTGFAFSVVWSPADSLW